MSQYSAKSLIHELEGGCLPPIAANAQTELTQRSEQPQSTKQWYNGDTTMSGIPLETYDYVVNGKPALEWMMERQCVKTDKASGIVNDANRYAIETVGDRAYPLPLFQRVSTVSPETMKIVKALPPLGDLS